MKAAAAFTAKAAGGATRLTTLRSSPPLSLRSTPDGLYLVGSGAGPIGGDELSIDVVVDAGADVVLRSAAASIILPGPSGAPSTMAVRARVAGSLSWEPEPTVLVQGCDHRTSTTIFLAPGARLRWREEAVLGRHDAASGSLLQRLHVDIGDAPLLRTELAVGPRWPGSAGPAVLDGATAVGSLLLVGGREPSSPAAGGEVRASLVPVAEGAWLVTAVARRHADIRRVLDAASPEVSNEASDQPGDLTSGQPPRRHWHQASR